MGLKDKHSYPKVMADMGNYAPKNTIVHVVKDEDGLCTARSVAATKKWKENFGVSYLNSEYQRVYSEEEFSKIRDENNVLRRVIDFLLENLR